MGKQVAVAMLEQDEAEFLGFLRSTATIRLFRWSAPTAETLSVESFADDRSVCWQFFIWNTAFPWEPSVRYVPADAPVVERRGWAYISNSGTAPVLEYDRHNFSDKNAGGRIYWAKYFVASKPLTYDVADFERWYDRVARWLRKQGRRITPESRGPYYLPHAFAALNRVL